MLSDSHSTTLGSMFNTRPDRGDQDACADIDIWLCCSVILRSCETADVNRGFQGFLQGIWVYNHERGERAFAS